MDSNPALGALGGAADEAGAELRASVAAWAVAYGLAGRPLPLKSLPEDESAIPVAVRLETDFPVDDIQVDLKGGSRVFVQVKTRLSFGSRDPILRSVLGQFARASKVSSLDRHKDRLVLAVGRSTRELDSLFSALIRAKNSLGGRPSARERRALSVFDGLMPELDAAERAVVHAVACGFVFPQQRTDSPVGLGSRGRRACSRASCFARIEDDRSGTCCPAVRSAHR